MNVFVVFVWDGDYTPLTETACGHRGLIYSTS